MLLPNIRTDECTLNKSLKVGGCSRDNRHTPQTISEIKVHSGTKREQSGETWTIISLPPEKVLLRSILMQRK